MVAEGRVLLRVEHLEHRARRVAAEVGAHLVDLVDHQHRVVRAGVAQRAEDRPGHRPDVGAAVAADLRLVAHAADRDALERALQAAGDRAARARSCPRRAGRRSRGSTSARRASACARRGTRGCGPSPPRCRSGRGRAACAPPSGRACPRSTATRAGWRATPGRCGSRPCSADCGGRRSKRWSSRSACLQACSGRPASLELLAQLLRLGLAARRPRRAPPGSPSAAGAGSTRAGPCPSRTGPATGCACRSPPARARGRAARRAVRSRLVTFALLEQLLLVLGLDPQRPGDHVRELGGVVEVGDRDLELLRQVGQLLDDSREGGLHVAVRAPRARATARPRRAPRSMRATR